MVQTENRNKGGRPLGPKAKALAYALAERKALLLTQLYKLDCPKWLKDQVKTRDEHDKIHPVKAFPMMPYVKPTLEVFQAEKVTFVVKSRQMMFSWLSCAFALWTAQFFEHQLVLMISEKFEKSSSLVERMRFMYERQTPWLINNCPLDRQMRDMPQGTMSFKNGSKVLALPEGPDQVRMHTASLAVLDEADFHTMFKKTYEACLPAIHGGGKLIALSSVNGSQFSKMCGLT